MVLGLAAVLAGGLVVAGFATALQAGAAEQAAAPATAQSPAALPAGRTYTVTLLTGDAVTVHTRSSGCPIVSVKPADPKGVLNRSCGPDGHVRVVPGAVAALVGPVLDPSLFDVTTLIAEGFDDTHSEDLPLIVQVGTPTAKTAKTADPLAVGMSRKRTLSSVGAVSGRQPKARGGEFVRALMAGRAAQQSAPAARASTRVWLDRRVRASAVGALTGAALDGSSAVTLAKADKLDRNLKQIGAPAAWSAGFTGQGTKVAVLDTGADFTHPDLVGKVDEQADFTVDGGDAVDHFGHGTHVASTIAGTGAAANGARKGVAPGARLLIGKVLHDNGYGSSSDVIAGMEWAAPRAKVVNMSLGNSEPSDGSDPLSAAVDALSNQYGTLFVVAAGNAGSMDGQVGGPGAASTALTVGAVDGSDALAEFSSRGPLVNTRAAKPELVAPGVDIVAARAAGTTMGVPVDANYTTASGTSMATPHVAGAAAILAQRHPQWTAAQLKAVLTGAVDPLPGADPYAVGAGRLNIARALAGVSSARGVVNLGAFAYPQAGTADTTLAWSNATPGTVTLSLELKVTDRHGESAPAGAVTLSASSVPVAAGAGGDVVLRVDRAALAAGPGFYAAVVTARTADDLVSSTPVTFFVEPPGYDLTITSTDLPATPADAIGNIQTTVVNLDDPAIFQTVTYLDLGQSTTIRVPAGRYSVLGSLIDYSPASGHSRMALIGDPDVQVGADQTLTMDAAHAEPVTATVDGVDTEAFSVIAAYEQTARRGPVWSDFAVGVKSGSVFVAPLHRVETGVGAFQVYSAFSLKAPGNGPSPYQYDLIHPLHPDVPAEVNYRLTAAEQAALARIDERFHHLDTPGTTTSSVRYGLSPTGNLLTSNEVWDRAWTLPDQRADYVSPGYLWSEEAVYDNIPGLRYPAVSEEAYHSYLPGSRQEKDWIRQPLRPDWYDDPQPAGGCQPDAPSRTSGNLHISLDNLTDQHQRFSCVGFNSEWTSQTTRTLALYRNGQLVAQKQDSSADFAIPAQAADYRLIYDQDASSILPVSTKVNTAWTFHSAGPAGTESVPLALLSIDYALPLDLSNHPTDGKATLTVRQAHGAATQHVTSLALWASTDDGTTWTTVPVARTQDGQYTAQLPVLSAGEAMSLRVKAEADGGSGVEQTVIRAYRAG